MRWCCAAVQLVCSSWIAVFVRKAGCQEKALHVCPRKEPFSFCTVALTVVSKQHRNQLLDRVDRLERLLAKTLEEKTGASLQRDPSSDTSDSTPDVSLTREDDLNDEARDISTPSSVEQPALGSLHFAGWRLGSINSSSGIPVFSEHGEQWIRSRTGEDASLERITALRQSWHNIIRSDWGSHVNLTDINLQSIIPDRQVVEDRLALYRRSFVCHVFPLVDPVLFQNTIAIAYSSTSSHSAHDLYNAQACLLAFLAFISFFTFQESTESASNADQYSLTAFRILTGFSVPATVETLQTAAMLVSISGLLIVLCYLLTEHYFSYCIIPFLGTFQMRSS